VTTKDEARCFDRLRYARARHELASAYYVARAEPRSPDLNFVFVPELERRYDLLRAECAEPSIPTAKELAARYTGMKRAALDAEVRRTHAFREACEAFADQLHGFSKLTDKAKGEPMARPLNDSIQEHSWIG
jgi:hypothetical protein